MNLSSVVSSLLVIIFFFVSLFAYTKLAGPLPFYINQVQTSKNEAFTVQGTGKATVKPTSASVTVGVTADAATSQLAQDALNAAINKVSTAIKALGISSDDIQTQNYNVNPKYDYSGGVQRATGFTANTNMTIKIRNIDLANKVLDTAVASGATQVGNVQFEADDQTQAEEEARQKAVADAKKKAEQAAKTVGFKLGNIINYSESLGGNGRVVPYAADAALNSAKTTQIEPGTNEVNLTVNISYELK